MQKSSKHFKIQARSCGVHAMPHTLRNIFLIVFPRTLNFYLLRVFQATFLALVSFSVSAKTFFTTEHIFTPPNSTLLKSLKIGPNHAIFISQTNTPNFAEKGNVEIYVLDARTKSVTKKAEVRVYESSVITTKVSSREVWVDILGNLFLADSVTGEITLIKDFGAAYGGSLGPWQSCLGFGEEIFVVNNFSYLRISNQCEVDKEEARIYAFNHKTKTLRPIHTNQSNGHINTSRSFLITDNPKKGGVSAIAIVSDYPQSEQDTPPVQFWGIEPTSRSLTLLNETQDHFIYSRFRGSAKTTKGVFICDYRRVVRVSNSLTIDTVPGSTDTGCNHITEYRDHIFWEPDYPHDQSKLWYSGGTLVPSKSINDLDSSSHLKLGCKTWGKLFYEKLDSSHRPTHVSYVNEEFNSTSINLEAAGRVESCLDNQLVVTNHPKRSIYNLLTTKNTPIRGNNVNTIVQLDNRLFGLKRKTKLDEYDNEVTIGVSVNELVESEFINLVPVKYLLLSGD